VGHSLGHRLKFREILDASSGRLVLAIVGVVMIAVSPAIDRTPVATLFVVSGVSLLALAVILPRVEGRVKVPGLEAQLVAEVRETKEEVGRVRQDVDAIAGRLDRLVESPIGRVPLFQQGELPLADSLTIQPWSNGMVVVTSLDAGAQDAGESPVRSVIARVAISETNFAKWVQHMQRVVEELPEIREQAGSDTAMWTPDEAGDA
jgi:hypothetical protein